MISLRSAYYCNIKFLLIYFVVLGHWIEPYIHTSKIACIVYKLIYAFHMPAFAFLTGLFARSAEYCKRQCLRFLKLYGVLQLVVVLLIGGAHSFITPWWILWYLLSAGIWMGVGCFWLRVENDKNSTYILIGAMILSCGVGYLPFIGRPFSLSRTIVFFPYYYLGLLYRGKGVDNRNRKTGFLLGLAAMALWIFGLPALTPEFFYHADPYGDLLWGGLYRLISYGIGIGFLCFILSFMTNKRVFFTKIGVDTLPAYLLHGPMVLLLRQFPIPWYLIPIFSFGVLWVIHKGACRYRRLYGITE